MSIYIPILNLIPLYNSAKRARNRSVYLAEYVQRPEAERLSEDQYYEGKTVADVVTELDLKLGERVEEYERRAEQFLTLSSSGALAIIATLFANSTEKISLLVIISAVLLTLSFLLVAVLKIMQTDTAYFRQGEWQKNHRDFLHKKITLGELSWRTIRSHKAPKVFAHTALTSLALMVVGVIFLIASIWPTTASPMPFHAEPQTSSHAL
ncbi:hypothetical protein [Aminobacter sp. HY435]|uniref:hypothetical protein n=1 Tax=Aminobacter sp. HY435 TaxID=2970917 RepID=UPI0022B970ED|nr:hypothetical protein [Aminobacter sp. HY435]